MATLSILNLPSVLYFIISYEYYRVKPRGRPVEVKHPGRPAQPTERMGYRHEARPTWSDEERQERSSDGTGSMGRRRAEGQSRLDRRKARTRQALIDAAVRLIAEDREDRPSKAEITEEADIGFGSFYNHFDSKEQLFQDRLRRMCWNAGGR